MNQDNLKRFPNQNIELRQTECCGETVADLLGNLSQQAMDAGFNYAHALKVMNTLPSTAGSDPYSGMLGGMIYGALPTEKEPFDATTNGELYEANWANYPYELRQFALNFAENGIVTLRSYAAISDWLNMNKGGVSLALQFYNNFLMPQSNGMLTEPAGNFTYHNCAVYEATPIGLRCKMWLGPDYGVSGYVFLNERVFDEVFIGAWAFNPQAWRWLSLAYAGVTHPYILGDILPQMKKR